MTPISIVSANQILVHKTCLYVMIAVSLSLSLIISHALLPVLIVKAPYRAEPGFSIRVELRLYS